MTGRSPRWDGQVGLATSYDPLVLEVLADAPDLLEELDQAHAADAHDRCAACPGEPDGAPAPRCLVRLTIDAAHRRAAIPAPRPSERSTMTTTHGHTGLVGEIADWLQALEELHHQAGWDNTPATLYVVVRDPTTGQLEPCPARLGLRGIHPRQELELIAGAMGEDVARELYGRTSLGAPVGWLLVQEMWQQESLPGESSDDADRRLRGRAFADMLGSVECRVGLGLVGTHRFIVHRERGKPVRWTTVAEGDAFGGDMFLSMVKLQAAARDLVSP